MVKDRAKHTPGPWRVYARHVDNDGTQDEMSGLGFDIEGPPEPQLRGQFSRAADAYLAAAAPTLKAALLGLRDGWGCFCREFVSAGNPHTKACVKANAALRESEVPNG